MRPNVAVEQFLSHQALAIVGVSRSGKKFGNYALRALRTRGYRVYPIHPTADTLEGERCYRHFRDLPEPVTAAVVVVPPVQAVDVIREAADAGVRDVWLQQGAESDVVLAACREAGVEPVAGKCILMFAQPTGPHRVHRWLHDIRRRFGTDTRQ